MRCVSARGRPQPASGGHRQAHGAKGSGLFSRRVERLSCLFRCNLHPMRAALYTRLSLDREGQTSTERQEADCRAWVEKHGGQVALVFTEVGVSGYREVARPQFELALDALRSGEVDTLVVWKLDRLSRRGIGQVGALLDDLERTGGRLVAVQDALDTAQSGSRVVIALLSELARMESANTGTRTRSAKRAMALSGRWMGGRPPWGYALGDDHRLVQDPTQATVVLATVKAVMAGSPVAAESRRLNEEGHLGRHGAVWNPSKLAQALRSPTLAGWLPDGYGRTGAVRRDPTGAPISVTDEPLLTVAEYRALQSVLTGRRPRAGGGRGRSPNSLLAGLVRCSCGYRMHAGGEPAAGKRAYVCARPKGTSLCRGCSVSMAMLDEDVSSRALRRLAGLADTALANEDGTHEGVPPRDSPPRDVLEAVGRRWLAWKRPAEVAELVVLDAAVAEAEARLADLEEARYVRGEFPGADGAERYGRLREVLVRELEHTRAERQAIPEPQADLGPLLDPELSREAWAVATLEDRRAVIGLVVDSVEVRPGRGPGRWVVRWV